MDNEVALLLAEAEIDRYCLRSDIPPRTKYRIRLVFEELVQQLLIPVLPEPRTLFVAEYSEAEQKVEITVLYNGTLFGPADAENELSYMVLKNTTFDLRHEAAEEEGFTNRFQCAISDVTNADIGNLTGIRPAVPDAGQRTIQQNDEYKQSVDSNLTAKSRNKI